MRDILESFLLGLSVGAGKCTLVCGPVLAGYFFATGRAWSSNLKTALLFCLWKALPYLVCGWAAGYFGREFHASLQAGHYQDWVRFAAGILMIIMAAVLVTAPMINQPACHAFHRVVVGRFNLGLMTTGLLMGFFPCPQFIGMLAYVALSLQDPIRGVVFAGVFAVGSSLPLLAGAALVGFFPGLLRNNKAELVFRWAGGIVIFIWAVGFLL